MGYHYILYDYFDGDTSNPVTCEFKSTLVQGQILKRNGVTYCVEKCDYWGVNINKEYEGVAILRMTRYRISDTNTQFIHKCPVRKKSSEKLDRDDVLKLEKRFGKVGAEKKIKAWKKGRTKMQSYNKLETTCPLCGCVFYKKHNSVPDTVQIDGVMKKRKLKK